MKTKYNSIKNAKQFQNTIILGLDKLMFFCTEWARKNDLINAGPFCEEHICILLLMFALGILPYESTSNGKNHQWFSKVKIHTAYKVNNV